MQILIATNGFKGTWPAIEYGAWLGAALRLPVLLLGITEKLNPAQIDDHHPLEELFSRAVELFTQNQLEYSLEIQNGTAEPVIVSRAAAGECITVLGPLGRPHIRHLIYGRSIHRMIEQIAGPLVYVPNACLPPKSILICVGGLGYEVTVENLGIRLAGLVKARVTLLHVIPPMDLNYPTAREVKKGGTQHLAESNTLPGRALRKGLELAQAAGLQSMLKVREGNIVEEILKEMSAGGYDLVCMGSPLSTKALRQMYAPNVAAEVAEEARCPILVARHRLEK
ncbi:MAG: universal stress protein [Bacteroidota bacterium]